MRLGAVEGAQLTDVGRRLQRMPLPPRLARMLVAAEGATSMARACALLSERHVLAPTRDPGAGDHLGPPVRGRSMVERPVPRSARRTRDRADSRRVCQRANRSLSESEFRRAVLAGYPDRVAQRREPQSPRVRLASGAGAVVAPESGVTEASSSSPWTFTR